jgi:hypothetical protein
MPPMSWKTAFRSFYYETAEEPEDIVLPSEKTRPKRTAGRRSMNG